MGLVPAAGLAAKGGGADRGGGKPGGGDSASTISLVLLESVDGLAHFGQEVTFDVSTTATDYPWVTAKCFQDGALVYQQSNGMFPTSLNDVFTLGPTPSWQGGGATCTATLENWDSYAKNRKIVALASMSFTVEP